MYRPINTDNKITTVLYIMNTSYNNTTAANDVNDKTCGKQKGETEDHVIDMHSVSNSMKFDR